MISAFVMRQQRRVDAERAAPSTPALVASGGQALERRDELRPAVRVPGVVERVDADEDVARAEHLGPRRARATGTRCCAPARRSTGCRPAVDRRGPSGRRSAPVSADPPNAARSTCSSTWRTTPSARGHDARRLDLPRVPLTVGHREGVQLEPLVAGDGRGRRGIEAAAQEHDRRGRQSWRIRAFDSADAARLAIWHSAVCVLHSASCILHFVLSDPPRRGSPDVLVHLQLQAHRAGDPRGSRRTAPRGRARRAPARTGLPTRGRRGVLGDHVARELVVGAILDDELHLVVEAAAGSRFAQSIRSRLAAGRALDVHHGHDALPARASRLGGRRSRAGPACPPASRRSISG